MVEPCPFRCINQKIHGYACPWLGHRTYRQHQAVADLYESMSNTVVETVGAALTREDIFRAVRNLRATLDSPLYPTSDTSHE